MGQNVRDIKVTRKELGEVIEHLHEDFYWDVNKINQDQIGYISDVIKSYKKTISKEHTQDKKV